MTTTSFRVMVCEAEPYSFQTCAAQQVQSSVRITHITFTPPTNDEVEAYVQHQQKLASTTKPSRTNTGSCLSTVARLRTLCASGKLESYTVACFPWSQPSKNEAVANYISSPVIQKKNNKRSGSCSPRTSTAAATYPVERVKLAGIFEVPLPRQTDICSNVDLRLDVDGSVYLEVVGPGSVTFFGEQYSTLIPEWLNHRFFTVGDDDEEEGENEEEDYDDDDVAAMYRLIR